MKTALFNGQGDFLGERSAGRDQPGCFSHAVSDEIFEDLRAGRARWSRAHGHVVLDPPVKRVDKNITPAHEDHLREIQESFVQEVDRKYRAGVIQHGGMLWTKPYLIDKAMEECVDQYVFLFTLKMQQQNPELVDPMARDIDEPER